MKIFRQSKVFLASLLFFLSFIAPVPALAVDVLPDDVCNKSPRPAVCADEKTNSRENPLFGVGGIITRAVYFLSSILGIVAVFVLIVAGVRFITSGGNQQTVSSVRNQIIYAVVGLAVAASAQLLVLLILKKL